MLRINITFSDSRFINYQKTDGTENDSHSKRGKARHHFNWVGDLVADNHVQPVNIRSDLFFSQYYHAGWGVCLV